MLLLYDSALLIGNKIVFHREMGTNHPTCLRIRKVVGIYNYYSYNNILIAKQLNNK